MLPFLVMATAAGSEQSLTWLAHATNAQPQVAARLPTSFASAKVITAARLAATLLSIVLAAGCMTKSAVRAPESPWPRALEDIARRQAVFHAGSLWVLAPGKVERIDVPTGARSRVAADSGTIALHRTVDDRLWAASHRDGIARVFELRAGAFVPVLETAGIRWGDAGDSSCGYHPITCSHAFFRTA